MTKETGYFNESLVKCDICSKNDETKENPIINPCSGCKDPI